MLKPVAMFAAAGFIGVLLTKLLMMLMLPLVGMFIGFVFLVLKVLLVVSLIWFGYWLFTRASERPSEG
jgi:hypothetical protein